jgi:hypothetical protein
LKGDISAPCRRSSFAASMCPLSDGKCNAVR